MYWYLRNGRLARSRARSLTVKETLATIDRTALRRLEGNGCLPAALRAIGHGLGFGETGTGGTLALCLASLAALGFILKILIVEEMLFSRCEYKFGTAIDARETAVLKLRHGLFPVDNLEQFIEPPGGGLFPPGYYPWVQFAIPLPGETSSGFVYGPTPA
jgi:hypothetical protein